MKRFVFSTVCVLATCQALAFGHWLERVPYGGIETGRPGAVDRAALKAKFGELSSAYANESMVDGGGFTSRLDTSHTCSDWKSVLALGPRGSSADFSSTTTAPTSGPVSRRGRVRSV